MTSTKLLLHRKSTYLLHSVFLKCATAKKHLFVDLTFYSKQQALCVRPSTNYLPTWAAKGGGMHSQFTGFSMLNLKTGWTGEIMFLLIEKKKTLLSQSEKQLLLWCVCSKFHRERWRSRQCCQRDIFPWSEWQIIILLCLHWARPIDLSTHSFVLLKHWVGVVVWCSGTA